MKIVITGAGSGGHITPLLAIAKELKKIDSKVQIYYIGQKGDKFIEFPKNDNNINEVFEISAGKFRRYHGAGLKQLLDAPTVWKNSKDLLKAIRGIVQSYALLGKIKPDVIFIKGGYIGVPVGLSAKMRDIPYITHDSDVVPGLANKIVSPWAIMHTTALPSEKYKKSKSINVGVPVSSDFKLVTSEMKNEYKNVLGLKITDRVLLITGGGLGSKLINDAILRVLDNLLKELPDLYIYHVVGTSSEDEIKDSYKKLLSSNDIKRTEVKGYISDLYKYSGAADLIVTRAGATNLAEYSIQAKACLVIPNPKLVGGHQIKNARLLEKGEAIEVLEESELLKRPLLLGDKIVKLINDPHKLNKLANNLNSFANPDAAKKLADVIYSLVEKK
jgi:UDP-N-acetylglucosamine--N-acetylmuramyl-(pentapeptide) pyrophosphoryl-undecaprenol N-acetylglucosamine transferase